MSRTPPAASKSVSERMSRTRRRDTGPELALRSELHRRGLRFRVDFPPIKGVRRRADVVFTRHRIAVFVDGCFWHSCPIHATQPKRNIEFWRTKLEANRKRDADTDMTLRHAGWHVVRIWEHEDAAAAADRVEETLAEVRNAVQRRVDARALRT